MEEPFETKVACSCDREGEGINNVVKLKPNPISV